MIKSKCLDKIVELRNVELEKYGRILADIYVDGPWTSRPSYWKPTWPWLTTEAPRSHRKTGWSIILNNRLHKTITKFPTKVFLVLA